MSNFGATATTTADKALYATNFTNPRKNNMIRVYSIGNGRNYIAAIPGKYELSGTMEFEVQNAQHMRYALGSIDSGTTATTDLDGTTVTSASAIKRYKCSESNVLESFNINQYHISDHSTADLHIRYRGCKVNQMVLRADTENPLHATFDWIGQREQIVSETASVTITSFTDTPPMFYKGTLSLGGTVDHTTTPGKVTSDTNIAQCSSLEATLVNNLEPYWSINASTGRGLKFATEKQREYSLTLDLNFTNNDNLRRFYDGTTSNSAPLTSGTYTPFLLTLDYTEGTAAASQDNFKQLRFIFEDVVFDETEIPVNPQDIVKQTITAFAEKLTVYNITNEALTN